MSSCLFYAVTRCEYFDVGGDVSSYTCNHSGGYYCGKYRQKKALQAFSFFLIISYISVRFNFVLCWRQKTQMKTKYSCNNCVTTEGKPQINCSVRATCCDDASSTVKRRQILLPFPEATN